MRPRAQATETAGASVGCGSLGRALSSPLSLPPSFPPSDDDEDDGSDDGNIKYHRVVGGSDSEEARARPHALVQREDAATARRLLV